MGYIYKVTNSINGKVYIGQIRRTIEIRWKEHVRDSYRPSRSYTSILHYAIRKYGENVFSIEQLEKCENKFLNSREKYWIEYYDSCNNGYNISHGGMGYMKCSDEEILTLWDEGLSSGEIAKELDLCTDTVSRRLKSCDITLDEIVDRGMHVASQKKMKPVYKYDLDGNYIEEYKTIKLAEASIGGLKINFPPDYVSPIGGFQWRRKKEEKIEPVYTPKVRNNRPKAVYQYTIDGQYIDSYRSALEAAHAVGGKSSGAIRSVCNGVNKTYYGYRWSFDKYDTLPPLKYESNKRQVIRINMDTGEETLYHSVASAARDNDTYVPDIIHTCKGHRKFLKGYYWKYATDIQLLLDT